MITTIPAIAANIAANVIRNGPSFNSDQVSKLTPQELGDYVAYMIGTQDDLEKLAAFVNALKGYNKDDSEAFREAFSQALDRRYNGIDSEETDR
jgi:hypothetical protein